MRETAPLLAAMAVVCLVPLALAHGDAPSMNDRFTIGPGEEVRETREVHWHRILGTIESDDLSVLQLRAEGPGGTTPLPIDARGRVNTLIRCCLDETWAEHAIILRNTGNEPVEVRMQLSAIHDDFAVMADEAEGGSGIGLVVLSAVTAGAAWRSRPTGTPDAVRARRMARTSQITLIAAWSGLLTMSALGMAWFSVGPLAGSQLAVAAAPLPGPLVGSHLLAIMVLFALWTTALYTWSASRRWSERRTKADLWLPLGILLGGPLFAIAFAIEYGNLPVVIGYSIGPVLAFLVALWIAARVDRQKTASPPAA